MSLKNLDYDIIISSHNSLKTNNSIIIGKIFEWTIKIHR